MLVSTHSRLKAAGLVQILHWIRSRVSTHSRLKAAGFGRKFGHDADNGFNTQPPEGGWRRTGWGIIIIYCFNTQPPEGGWTGLNSLQSYFINVSTHSRLKAAGNRSV